jgi:hypothetical protein
VHSLKEQTVNGKKARVLRAFAQQITVGRPARQLSVGKRVQVRTKVGDKEVTHDRVTIINHPQSTRGVYRKLKKEYRKNPGILFARPARA